MSLFLLIMSSIFLQFNLSDFTRRAYGTNYIETLRVQVGVYIVSFFALILSI